MNDLNSEIQRRREALRVSKAELAREAGVNRDTIGDIENGKGFQVATMDKITAALDRLEAEAGLDAPEADPGARMVEFRVEDLDGVKFVVKGPISDLQALRQAANDLVDRERRRSNGPR